MAKMMKHKFSIVICTYNGARTIGKVIDTISNQKNYDKFIDEIVVVDNASTDETKEIVLNKKKNNPDIIYSFESKSGLSYARLNGVMLVKNEWTVFIDDDNELRDDWIEQAAKFIENNRNIGIFGGEIIPKIEFEITEHEIENLKFALPLLACTHYSESDIDINQKINTIGTIIGAGMVVKTIYLKELSKAGWINCVGRTRDDTEAGDDLEILRYVTDIRKINAGHCPYMVLYHNLPKSRLEDQYLLRLRKSIVQSSYYIQSQKKWYALRRIKELIRMFFISNQYPKGTLQYKMEKERKRTYLSLIWRDKLILKRKK